MKKEIVIWPAWDHRNNNPNYGIGACRLFMVLSGDLGCITFEVNTAWYPDSVDFLSKAKGAIIGYHCHKPQFEGHQPSEHDCAWIDFKPCYFDLSALQADPAFTALLHDGTEGAWKILEIYYQEKFGELK